MSFVVNSTFYCCISDIYCLSYSFEDIISGIVMILRTCHFESRVPGWRMFLPGV